MTAILTVTLNPAVDIFTSTERVADTHKLRCSAPLRHPGGGGINVARVAHRLGADVLALYASGGRAGQQLDDLLAIEQVNSLRVAVTGETRENMTVLETSTGHEFRFVLPGPMLGEAELQACIAPFTQMTAPRFLVLSGSLPPGVPLDHYARWVRLARERGTQVVLDTSGAALLEALKEGVYLFKPSLRELRELTGLALQDEAQWVAACRQLIGQGQTSLVALSLGEQGALLVSATQSWRAQGMNVPVRSATGAGDSFLAAMVCAMAQDADMTRALRLGVAAGSAAVMSEGTALCLAKDVERLVNQVQVQAARLP
jgi:6-phosphofructokinase 2